uniref:Uncharacterized protein n=1 Tax=Oryza brachyantha TaxID=4533 RepID=J3LBP2_ORYBR
QESKGKKKSAGRRETKEAKQKQSEADEQRHGIHRQKFSSCSPKAGRFETIQETNHQSSRDLFFLRHFEPPPKVAVFVSWLLFFLSFLSFSPEAGQEIGRDFKIFVARTGKGCDLGEFSCVLAAVGGAGLGFPG